jgi:hypothetical protein
MTLDDETITECLDGDWRNVAQIRSRLRQKGFNVRFVNLRFVESLRRLAETGKIERQTIETTAPKRGSQKLSGNYAIEYFRRIQGHG